MFMKLSWWFLMLQFCSVFSLAVLKDSSALNTWNCQQAADANPLVFDSLGVLLSVQVMSRFPSIMNSALGKMEISEFSFSTLKVETKAANHLSSLGTKASMKPCSSSTVYTVQFTIDECRCACVVVCLAGLQVCHQLLCPFNPPQMVHT